MPRHAPRRPSPTAKHADRSSAGRTIKRTLNSRSKKPLGAAFPTPCANPLDPRSLYSAIPFDDMPGGVAYETMPSHHSTLPSRDHMQEWSMPGNARREKDSHLNDSRPIASPTYSHASLADSTNRSPYNMPLSGPSYPHPYGTHLGQNPPHLNGYAAHSYYAHNGHEVYTESHSAPPRPKYPPAFAGSSEQYSSTFNPANGPLLTNSTLVRSSYDTTIPQYYPITSDPRWSGQLTPDKVETGQKRKRERSSKKTPPSAADALKTPTRGKPLSQDEVGSLRANKRLKLGKSASIDSFQPEQLQLPTPPSTGRDVSHLSLPAHIRAQPSEELERIDEESEFAEEPRRRGVVVTVVQDEGRKLGLVGVAGSDSEEAPSPEGSSLSPRLKSMPVVSTDASGMAILSTEDVLETEVAWLENGGRTRSPPSSPDLTQLRTPVMTNTAVIIDDTPMTKAEKVSKRMELFSGDDRVEEAMISTKISMFGRVAVRKATAINFLGLDSTAHVVEETGMGDFIMSSASSSRKPLWPDSEAPWALAGGKIKEKKLREEQQRSESIRRYLETTSDESSDDEDGEIVQITYGRGKGKSVQKLVPANSPVSLKARRWDGINADARISLLTAVRNRPLPRMPAPRVDCSCGVRSVMGRPIIECHGCKSWHHMECCGIDEDTQLGPQWWCSTCSAEAIALSTPGHSTPRVYTQPDDRSSAFKGEMSNIALAPSPMFPSGAYTQTISATRTPMNRVMASPTSRQHRSRILSYGTDMWAYTEDGAPSSAAPSTPGPSRPDRFSTPRVDDLPFDVTSTPSRHLDFNFGQPSLFGLTPLGARGRVASGHNMLLEGTPFRARALSNNAPLSEIMPSRHEFFRELNKAPHALTDVPQSPQTLSKWPHALLGAHNLSPSPFGHKRSISGNKMSSIRSSSRSGLAAGMIEDRSEEC